MAEPRRRLQPLRRIVALVALASTIVLAACQPTETARRPAGPPPPPKLATPSRPTPEAERNRVAVLVPLTGSNAGLGQSIANAANLALLDTGGKHIRITMYDTGPGAAGAAQRALADGNRLFLGPLLAEDVRIVQPIARAAGVPVISFSNDSSVAGNGTYVMGFSPVQSIERVVDFARSKGAQRFAGLMPAGVYGGRASNAFLRAVEAAGGRVVAMQTYSRDGASIAAAVRKLTGGGAHTQAQIRPDGSVAAAPVRTAGFDALMIADSGRIAVAIAPMLQKNGAFGTRLLGTELWNTEPGLAKVAGMRGAWFASVADAHYRQLGERYRARFGTPPYRLASLGYDAVLLTVKIAAGWEPGRPFPARALDDAGGFSGVDGVFRFDGAGVAQRALEVNQIEPGGFTVVSPAAARFGG